MAETKSILVTLTVDKKFDLDVTDFELCETLSEVPKYRVTVLDQETHLDELVGKFCEINLVSGVYIALKARKFSGIIMSVERAVDRSGSPTLEIELQSALGVLGLSVHSAIYQKKTSLEVLKEVLARNGLARMKIAGTKSKAKRDTVIQYNENDLDFCKRILSEEGLTFYFNDGTDPDTLFLHDVRKPFPKVFDIIELTDGKSVADGKLVAENLNLTRTFRPHKVELTHYDASKAAQTMAGPVTASKTKTAMTPSVLEYRPTIVGDLNNDELKILINASQRPELAISGECEHPAVYLGQEIKITSLDISDMNERYIISHLIYRPLRGNALCCQFHAVPVTHIPAPIRLPKPLISGVHNAIVVGPEGSKTGTVACDDKGRVLVKFFWDKTASDSGYIRVSEPFSGNGYGAQFTPRVGHEVLVSFLHGDPDAPVITGQLYTEKHQPPFAEKNTTKSGIRTQLEGLPNELEFDDKAGAELIGIRAAKDFELIVNENVTREIKMKETTTIAETSKLEIGDSWDIKVNNGQYNEADEITLKGKTKITLQVGQSRIELSASGILIDAPKVEIKGKSKVDFDSKGALTLTGISTKVEAKTALDLKGLNISAKASIKASLEGAMAEVKGTGVVTIKGGVTMIN